MQQGAVEPLAWPVMQQPLMHQIIRKAGKTLLEESIHIVRRPPGMAHELATKPGRPWNGKADDRARLRDGLQDFFTKFGCHPFIGIDGQDPIAIGEIKCPVFLRPKSGPVWCHRDLCSQTARHVCRAVRAGMVQNKDFISKVNTLKTVRDIRTLVAGNDNHGKGHRMGVSVAKDAILPALAAGIGPTSQWTPATASSSDRPHLCKPRSL